LPRPCPRTWAHPCCRRTPAETSLHPGGRLSPSRGGTTLPPSLGAPRAPNREGSRHEVSGLAAVHTPLRLLHALADTRRNDGRESSAACIAEASVPGCNLGPPMPTTKPFLLTYAQSIQRAAYSVEPNVQHRYLRSGPTHRLSPLAPWVGGAIGIPVLVAEDGGPEVLGPHARTWHGGSGVLLRARIPPVTGIAQSYVLKIVVHIFGLVLVLGWGLVGCAHGIEHLFTPR
jgi:hypothetical protein